jgi:phage-related tail protein
MLVRTADPVSSRDPQGKRFTTVLETDLVVNGTMVAKAGTKVYGRVQSAKQAGRYAGQSSLDLRLSEMAVGPTLVPLVTSGYTQAGAKSMQKTAKTAAAGAAIGAIADGGDGAAKGAAIGAVASGLKKGQPITVNPGTLLEFKLQQPLTVKVTS